MSGTVDSSEGRSVRFFHSERVDGELLTDRTVGLLTIDAERLRSIEKDGQKLDIEVVGALRFDDDVSADLAAAALHRVRVWGRLRAPSGVRDVLRSLAR